MKFKVIFPVAFSILLASFTSFSILDTLVLESTDNVEIVEDDSTFDESKFDTPKKEDPATEPTEDPIENPTENPTEEPTENPTEEPTEDPTEDPKKEDIIITDTLYQSADLKIEISKETIKTKHMTQNKMMNTIVYNADITMSSLSHLRTAFAKDKFGKNIKELTSTMAKRKEAVFAINGDFYGAQEDGYVLRNGTTYRETVNSLDREDLAIYYDGSYEIFKESEVILDDISQKGAYQVFSFGPGLVKNSEIAVTEDAEVSIFSNLGNQRCAIGIIDSLHYHISICDGRLSDSYGMSLYEMASYMKDKGCKVAYNLDGGGSATFWYNGKLLNRPNTNGNRDIGERSISDIVYFK